MYRFVTNIRVLRSAPSTSETNTSIVSGTTETTLHRFKITFDLTLKGASVDSRKNSTVMELLSLLGRSKATGHPEHEACTFPCHLTMLTCSLSRSEFKNIVPVYFETQLSVRKSETVLSVRMSETVLSVCMSEFVVLVRMSETTVYMHVRDLL